MMKLWDRWIAILVGWAPLLFSMRSTVVTKQNEVKAVLYATIAFSGFLMLSLVLYVVRRTCPDGLTLSPVQLDDIQLDGLEDIEASLRSSIDKLKVNSHQNDGLVSR